MDRFTGFGKNALAFFKGLKFHQSRIWFEENRALYEDEVLIPLVALLDDLTDLFKAKRIPLKADGKRSVFRLHRDIRFAKDKSPYKTHAGAVMTRSASKDDPGLLYIHISPEGCFVASGFYMPEPAALNRLRKALADRPARLRTLTAALGKGGLSFSDGEKLSRVPRGFEAFRDGPLADVLSMKSFIVEEPLSPEIIMTPALRDAVAGFAGRALPLLRFGWEALA